MAVSYRYTLRNNFVLLRLKERAITPGGVALPDVASESKDLVVEGFGPDVKDLMVGQKVHVVGTIGADVVSLPRDKGLLVTRQDNVVAVYEEDYH